MTIGIDIEQFVTDPYGTGIQRVLHQLALNWPTDVPASFVVPFQGGFGLLTPEEATQLLAIPFAPRDPETDLRDLVNDFLAETLTLTVQLGDLLAVHDGWLLPEVSYLPSVLQRLEIFERCMPTAMIGYDALPMTQPANYRFVPGTASWVSEYFRHLTRVDSVICISDYAADEITGRLRRDLRKTTIVAHPGGDHIAIRPPAARQVDAPVRFLRLGTLEARKQPVEILNGFREAIAQGANAELVFIGKPSASDQAINDTIAAAIDEGLPVTWIKHADDALVYDELHRADVFLSIGIEGYGIPVLEAIRVGTPVLYDGIQPAGELMEARGARRVDAGSNAALANTFVQFSSESRQESLIAELNSATTPDWVSFASTVAHTAARR
jgi:glycosyltransferase involved in cell wall biosynthesis